MKEYDKISNSQVPDEEHNNVTDSLSSKTKNLYYGMLAAAAFFAYEGTDTPAAERNSSDLVSIMVALSLLAGIGLNEYRKYQKINKNKNIDDQINDTEPLIQPVYKFSEKSLNVMNNNGEIEVFSKAIDLDYFDLQKLTDDSSFVPDYKALDMMKGNDTKLIRFKEN